MFLLFCLLATMFSCNKEAVIPNLDPNSTSFETSNPKTEITNERRGRGNRPSAVCCADDMLTVECIVLTPICSTYEIVVDHSAVPSWGCSVNLELPQEVIVIPAGQIETQQVTICRDNISVPYLQFEVGVFRYQYDSGIGDFIKFYCATETISSECLICPFTFAEGFTIGCGLGNDAESNNCCDPSCHSLYQNTIDDFQESCPEYVDGVQAGWAACNCDGNGGTPPELCGGEPKPTDFEECICIDDSYWDCFN